MYDYVFILCVLSTIISQDWLQVPYVRSIYSHYGYENNSFAHLSITFFLPPPSSVGVSPTSPINTAAKILLLSTPHLHPLLSHQALFKLPHPLSLPHTLRNFILHPPIHILRLHCVRAHSRSFPHACSPRHHLGPRTITQLNCVIPVRPSFGVISYCYGKLKPFCSSNFLLHILAVGLLTSCPKN